MSGSQKKGMQFFKKFSGDMKPNSILSGMKIKGAKEPKPPAQTETHLTFNDKKQQTPKALASKDDAALTNKREELTQAAKAESKVELNFKKTDSKTFQNNNTKVQKLTETVKVTSKVEQKVVKSSEVVQLKASQDTYVPPTQNNHQSKSKSPQQITIKSSKSIAQTPQKDQQQPTSSKKLEAAQKKTQTIQKKSQVVQKKAVQKSQPTKKPSNQLSQSTRKQSVRQPQKPKKSDREIVFDEMNQFTSKLVTAVIDQREIKLQITQTKQTISELRDSIAAWTSEQGLSAQREDYDQADRLQTLIEQAGKKLQQLEEEVISKQQQLVKQQQEEVNLLKAQNTAMKRLSRKLKLLEIQLEDEVANLKREEMEEIQAIRSKQEAERKKIQRIQKDINYQSEQISEYEKIFKAQLNSKMDPLQQQQSTLQAEKKQLQTEIKQLEQLLKQKKNSLTQVTKQLKNVVENITEIKESFKEETDKLQERKNNLEIMENERDQMELTITDMETKIAEEVKKLESKINQKNGEAKQLAELVKNIENKQNTFEDELELRRSAFDTFLLSARLVQEFQAKHKSEKEKIKETEYKKSTIGGQISKLQQKRQEIKKKIPGIELQQRKYADQKNFKAAGIKKSELKELNEQLNQIKERLDSYLNQQHALQAELQYLISSQKEANQEQLQLQRNLAASQIKFNKIKLEKLQEYHREISKAIGLSAKDKDRYLKNLQQEISRLQEECKYLISHFQAEQQSPKRANPPKPAEEQLQKEENHQELVEEKYENQELGQQKERQSDNEEAEQLKEVEYQPPSLGLGEELEQTEQGYSPPLLE